MSTSGICTGQTIPFKIGFIDIKEIRDSWPRYTQYKSFFEEESRKTESKLEIEKDAWMAEIDQMIRELEERRDLLNEEARKKRADEIRAKQDEWLKYYSEVYRELKDRWEKKMDEFSEILSRTVKNVALLQGYKMVFKKSNLAYADKDLDITEEIIKAILAEEGSMREPSSGEGGASSSAE